MQLAIHQQQQHLLLVRISASQQRKQPASHIISHMKASLSQGVRTGSYNRHAASLGR